MRIAYCFVRISFILLCQIPLHEPGNVENNDVNLYSTLHFKKEKKKSDIQVLGINPN